LGLLFSCLFRLPGAESPLSETDLIPKNTPLWDESMLWDDQLSVASGLGYKDNVLLAPAHPHGSAFFVNGLDGMVMRLPLDGWLVEGSIVGEDRRYWHAAGLLPSEDSFQGTLRLECALPDGWQAGLEANGSYEKQMQDVPIYGTVGPILVEGFGIKTQPWVRKNLSSDWWLKLELPVTRWVMYAPLDDNWDFGPGLTLGHDFGHLSEITLSYSATDELHDEWQAAANPNASDFLPQKLNIFKNQAELAWRQSWDAHQRWRSSTRLIFADLEDNGDGFFNEYQYRVVQDLRWQTTDWLIKASADLTYEDYPVEWMGMANGQTLYRDLWNLSGRVERRVYKGLKAYAELEYQRAMANYVNNAEDYHATTVSAGLSWEF
jgi:hypothetical protein